MRSTTKLGWLLLALVSFAPPTQSQRPNRNLEIGSYFPGQCLWLPGKDPKFFYAGDDTPSQLFTSISLAGDIAILPNEPHPVIALCGEDEIGHGSLELYEWSASGYQLINGGVFTSIGHDFTGVAWSSSAGTLFLLNSATQEIWATAYNPPGSAPTSWTTFATVASIPELVDAAEMHLVLREDHPFPGEESLVLQRHFNTELDRVVIPLVSGPPTAEPGIANNWATLEPSDTVVGATSVRVESLPGRTVEVLRLSPSPTVIGSAVANVQGEATVTLAEPLAVFDVYAARPGGVAEATPPELTPVYRDGAAEPLNGQTTIRPFDGRLGLTSYIGHSHFMIPLWLDPIDPDLGHSVGSFSALVIIGDASNVITLPDGRRFLASQSYVPVTAQIFDPYKPGVGIHRLPIPDEPLLAGFELYYQWFVVSGGQAKLSDIVGMALLPNEWRPASAQAAATSSGPSGASSAAQPTQAEIRAAKNAWLSSCGVKTGGERWKRAMQLLTAPRK